MRDLHSHREEGRTKSGDLVAALLFLSCISAMGTIAVISHILLAPADSLAMHVPAAVAVYVHADGRDAVNELSAIAPFTVPETTATEIAYYAVPGEDGTLVWRTLVGWRWPYMPTKQDDAALNAGHATMMNERTALLGAYSPEPAFGLDRAADEALKEARSRARVQAYADLSSLRPLGTSDTIVKDRFAASIVLRGKKALARITRVNDGATAETLSSFTLPLPDPFTTLFGEYPSEEEGPALRNAAAMAAHFLNDRSTTILIRDPRTNDARAQLVLQNTSAAEAHRTLDAYATQRWPEKTPLVLPDGDVLRELRSTSSDTDLTLRVGPSHKDVAKLHEGAGRVMVAKEGDTPPSPEESCPTPQTPILILSGKKGIVPWLPYSTIAAAESADGALIVCARK